MPIALDASTPVGVSGTGTGAIITASFTPPAGAYMVAVTSTGNSANSGTTGGTVTDSLSETWTAHPGAVTGTGDGLVQSATHLATGAAMTVTWTPNGTNGKGTQLFVFVLTGQSTSPIGNHATSNVATTGQLSFTPIQLGSFVVFGMTYAGAAVTLTPNGNSTTAKVTSDATNGESYGCAYLTLPTTTNSSNVTIGFSNTGLSAVQSVALEIFAAVPPLAAPEILRAVPLMRSSFY